MTERYPLLIEREKTHGSFKVNAEIWWKLMQAGHLSRLSQSQQLAMQMIYVKIARVLSAPQNKDSWDDIAGYAKLGSEACE